VRRWILTHKGELAVALTFNVLVDGSDAEALRPCSSAQHGDSCKRKYSISRASQCLILCNDMVLKGERTNTLILLFHRRRPGGGFP
jgi:hypothetical protein